MSGGRKKGARATPLRRTAAAPARASPGGTGDDSNPDTRGHDTREDPLTTVRRLLATVDGHLRSPMPQLAAEEMLAALAEADQRIAGLGSGTKTTGKTTNTALSVFTPPLVTRLSRDADALRGRVLRVVGEARVGDQVRKAATSSRSVVVDCLESIDIWHEERHSATRRSAARSARERNGSAGERVSAADDYNSNSGVGAAGNVPATTAATAGKANTGGSALAAHTRAAELGLARAAADAVAPPGQLGGGFARLRALTAPLSEYTHRRDMRRIVSQELEIARELLVGDYHGAQAAAFRDLARVRADALAAASGDWITVRVPIVACSEDLEAEVIALGRVVFPRLRDRFKTRRCRIVPVVVSVYRDADGKWIAPPPGGLEVADREIERSRPFAVILTGERCGPVIPDDGGVARNPEQSCRLVRSAGGRSVLEWLADRCVFDRLGEDRKVSNDGVLASAIGSNGAAQHQGGSTDADPATADEAGNATSGRGENGGDDGGGDRAWAGGASRTSALDDLRVFVYNRNPEFRTQIPDPSTWSEHFGPVDDEDEARMTALRHRLREIEVCQTSEYSVTYRPDPDTGVTGAGPGRPPHHVTGLDDDAYGFVQNVTADLTGAIGAYLDALGVGSRTAQLSGGEGAEDDARQRDLAASHSHSKRLEDALHQQHAATVATAMACAAPSSFVTVNAAVSAVADGSASKAISGSGSGPGVGEGSDGWPMPPSTTAALAKLLKYVAVVRQAGKRRKNAGGASGINNSIGSSTGSVIGGNNNGSSAAASSSSSSSSSTLQGGMIRLAGPPGCGKTQLAAAAYASIDTASRGVDRTVVVHHCVTASSRSADVRRVLRRLCSEVGSRLPGWSDDLPQRAGQLRSALSRLLTDATEQGLEVTIVIDDVDKAQAVEIAAEDDDADDAAAAGTSMVDALDATPRWRVPWLPAKLPAGVVMIVTTTTSASEAEEGASASDKAVAAVEKRISDPSGSNGGGGGGGGSGGQDGSAAGPEASVSGPAVLPNPIVVAAPSLRPPEHLPLILNTLAHYSSDLCHDDTLAAALSVGGIAGVAGTGATESTVSPLDVALVRHVIRGGMSHPSGVPTFSEGNFPRDLLTSAMSHTLDMLRGTMGDGRLVDRALVLIACSFGGVTEDELLEMLDLSPSVSSEIIKASAAGSAGEADGKQQGDEASDPLDPAKVTLNRADWARFMLALDPLLFPRPPSSSARMVFANRRVRDAVLMSAGSKGRTAAHSRLAKYFRSLVNPSGGRIWRPDYPHAYQEVLDQIAAGALGHEAGPVLLSLPFVEAVAATGKIVDLVSTYAAVLRTGAALHPAPLEDGSGATAGSGNNSAASANVIASANANGAGSGSSAVTDFYRFTHGNALQLHTNPRSTYRLALYEPRASCPAIEAHHLLGQSKFPEDVLCWTNRPEERDPCRLTLSTTGRVVACEYLRDHDGLVVSVTAAGELCVWDGKLGGVVKSVNMARGGAATTGISATAGIDDSSSSVASSIPMVRCLAVSSDHRALTAGTDRLLRVWNLNTMDLLASVAGHNEAITCVAVSADNRYIVTAAEDFSVRVYDGHSLEVVKHDINVSGTTGWLPQSKVSATAATSDAQDTHTDYITACSFRGGTHDIITGSRDGGMKVWSARDSWATRAPYQRRHDGRVNRIASAGGAPLTAEEAAHRHGKSGIAAGNAIHSSTGSSQFFSSKRGGQTVDRSRVVTCGDDAKVFLFEGRTGRLVAELEGHSRAVVCCAFTPDAANTGATGKGGANGGGSALGAASNGNNNSNNNNNSNGNGNGSGSSTIGALSETARIVTASIDGSVRVYAALSGDPLATYKLTMRGAMISWCSASPDGLFVASCGNMIKIYDGSPEPKDKAVLDDPVTYSETCSSGTLTALCHGCVVEIWCTKTLTKRLSFRCGNDDRDACAAVAFGACTVDPATTTNPQAGGGGVTIETSDAVKEPRLCAAGGEGSTVIIWDLVANRRSMTIKLPAGAGQVAALAFSPDDGALFAGTHDGKIRIWRLSDSRASSRASRVSKSSKAPSEPGPKDEDNCDNPFRDHEEVEGMWEGHSDWISSLVFSPQRNALFSGAADGSLRVWTLEHVRFNKAPRSALLKGHSGPVKLLRFSLDGRRVVTGSEDGTLLVWGMNPSGGWFRSSQLHGHLGAINTIMLSPDADGSGSLLVSASDDRTARVWDCETGQLLHTLRGHDAECGHCAFFPDCQTVATAGGDGRVACWDAVTGHLRAVFTCSSGVVTLAVSGDTVLVTTTDASVYVLRLALAGGASPTVRLSNALSSILGRNLALKGFAGFAGGAKKDGTAAGSALAISSAAGEMHGSGSGVQTIRRGSVLLRKGALRARKNTVRGMAPLSPITRKASLAPVGGGAQADRQLSVEGIASDHDAQEEKRKQQQQLMQAQQQQAQQLHSKDPAMVVKSPHALDRSTVRPRPRSDTGADGALFRPGMMKPGGGGGGGPPTVGAIRGMGGSSLRHSPLAPVAPISEEPAVAAPSAPANAATTEPAADTTHARHPTQPLQPQAKHSPRQHAKLAAKGREHNYGGTLRTVGGGAPQPVPPTVPSPRGNSHLSPRSHNAGIVNRRANGGDKQHSTSSRDPVTHGGSLPAVNTAGRSSAVAAGGSSRGVGGFGKKNSSRR